MVELLLLSSSPSLNRRVARQSVAGASSWGHVYLSLEARILSLLLLILLLARLGAANLWRSIRVLSAHRLRKYIFFIDPLMDSLLVRFATTRLVWSSFVWLVAAAAIFATVDRSIDTVTTASIVSSIGGAFSVFNVDSKSADKAPPSFSSYWLLYPPFFSWSFVRLLLPRSYQTVVIIAFVWASGDRPSLATAISSDFCRQRLFCRSSPRTAPTAAIVSTSNDELISSVHVKDDNALLLGISGLSCLSSLITSIILHFFPILPQPYVPPALTR